MCKPTKVLTLLSEIQKTMPASSHWLNIQMFLLDPAVYSHLLSQHIIPLDVFLMLAPSPRSMEPFHLSSLTPTGASGNRRRTRYRRREGLGIQSIHDEFLHALLGIVKLAIRSMAPDFTESHLVGDESQEVTDNLDLFVDHPRSFPKLMEKRAQKLGHRVRRAMPQLLEKSMKIKRLVGLGFRQRRNGGRGRSPRRHLIGGGRLG